MISNVQTIYYNRFPNLGTRSVSWTKRVKHNLKPKTKNGARRTTKGNSVRKKSEKKPTSKRKKLSNLNQNWERTCYIEDTISHTSETHQFPAKATYVMMVNTLAL